MRKLSLVASVVALSFLPAIAQAAEVQDAREAGARYGQALGASEACPGIKVEDTAGTLKSKFSGQDREVFDAAVARVYESWRKVNDCVRPVDPNPCRIIIQMSCQAALSEIGPAGSTNLHLLRPR